MTEAHKKYKSTLWERVQTFVTDEQEEIFFHANPQWKILNTFNTDSGSKTRYYCNEVKKKKCPAVLMLQQNNNGERVLYTNKKDHVHAGDGIEPSKPALAEATKNKIGQWTKDGVKPREIYINLQNDGGVPRKPTSIQVGLYFVFVFMCHQNILEVGRIV